MSIIKAVKDFSSEMFTRSKLETSIKTKAIDNVEQIDYDSFSNNNYLSTSSTMDFENEKLNTDLEASKNASISENISNELANTPYKDREGFNKHLKELVLSSSNKREAIVAIAYAMAVEYPKLTGKW